MYVEVANVNVIFPPITLSTIRMYVLEEEYVAKTKTVSY